MTTKQKANLWILIILCNLMLTPSASYGLSPENPIQPPKKNRLLSISPKKLIKNQRFEFTSSTAIDINDAFYLHNSISQEILYHISNNTAIGITADLFLPHYPQKSHQLVKEHYISSIADYSFPKLAVHADLQLNNIYGKAALFNRKIIYFDLYFTAGLGGYQNSSKEILPMANLAVGYRFYLTSNTTIKLELKDQIIPTNYTVYSQQKSSLQNYLQITVGISILLPFFAAEQS